MADTLILGGGLAGGAAALLLARAGKSVHLVERSAGPLHKICGEFLSVEAHRHLAGLGIDASAMGAAPIARVELASGRHLVSAPLPFAALGLSRHCLDEALLARAEQAGARLERGVRVTALEGVYVRTSAGGREARAVLLATGKLPVRGDRAVGPDGDENGFVGFKMHYRLAPAARARIDGAIRLVLFDGGYAGLQLVEGGRANLCLILRRDRLGRLGGGWDGVVAMLGEEAQCGPLLRDAEPLFERPVTISNLVYGQLAVPRDDPALFRLGDRAGMTASLTGDGMAIALRSAVLAAHCLTEGRAAADYHCRLRKQMGRQVGRAMLLQRAALHPALRGLGVGAARLWPALLGHLAAATRLDERDPPLRA